MSITGPDFVSFQVRDLATSAHFYEHTVGLTRIPVPNDHAAAFSDGTGTFAVRDPMPGTDLDAAPLGVGVGVWFLDPDAAELHRRLAEQGVPIATEPVEGPFGLTFAFTDPDGYTVTVHERA